LPQELVERFDVVFCHTVFEHIFEISKAFEKFCAMSKDVAIAIVPFAQVQHEEKESYMDYWRFTPTCPRKLFEANGMTSVYESITPRKSAANCSPRPCPGPSRRILTRNEGFPCVGLFSPPRF
jgi:hypothetical protein